MSYRGVGDFVVAGHSHIFCMGAPHSYRGEIALEPVAVEGRHGFFLMEEWHGGRTDEYWRSFVDYGETLRPILVFGGNHHFGDFLIRQSPFFDVVDPSATPAIVKGAVAVPRRMLQAHFAPGLETLRFVLSQLADRRTKTPVVVGTPPPRADLDSIIDHVRSSPFFRSVAEARGIAVDDIELTSATTLLKLWGITQELLGDVATEFGASFVSVPSAAIDSVGFLRPDFCGPVSDFTHANEDYGRMMLALATLATAQDVWTVRSARPSSAMSNGTLHIDLSEIGNGERYAGAGWSRAEPNGRWTVDTKADLRISGLDAQRDYQCEILVGPFVAPPTLAAQQLYILCGGIPLFSQSIETGTFVRFKLPKGAISANGTVRLDFMLPDARSPHDLGLSNDVRKLGVSVTHAKFDAVPPVDGSTAVTAPTPPQIAPVLLTPQVSVHARSSKAPVAAVTMVFNEPEYLPIWLRHYAKHVGTENCYVIDHGSDDGSTVDLGACNVIRVPRSTYDPILQSTFTAKFCSSLLCWYDRVLYCDVDEIILPDPAVASSLREFVSRPLPEILNVIGLNTVHRPAIEPPIDLSRPITEQRPYVFACSPACKPLLISRDVQWAGGSHSADAVVAFDQLYGFHLRWFDLPLGLRRIARTRALSWVNESAGGHARVPDEVFETQLNGFAHLPAIDHCEFDLALEPLAPFVEAVLRSQAGREFDPYKIDLHIWWDRLWRLPQRFIGSF